MKTISLTIFLAIFTVQAQAQTATNKIDSTGNVGIGDTNPANKLEVNGGAVRITTDLDSPLTFNNSDNSWQYMQFMRSYVRKAYMGLGSGNNFTIYKEGEGHIILGGVGNVGVGLSTPLEKLHVNGNLKAANGVYATGINNISTSKAIDISYNGTAGLLRSRDWDNASWLPLTYEGSIHSFLHGNVGIGTASPTSKLHVNGNIKIEDGGKLLFDRPTGATVGAIGWHTDDIFYVAGHPNNGPVEGNLVRVYSFGDDLRLGNSTNGDVLTIDGYNGNVGIGTASPSTLLHMKGDDPDINLDINSASTTANWVELKFNQDGVKMSSLYWSKADSNTYLSNEYGDFLINSVQNVGIGTSSPDSKLTVAGTVKSKEIIVEETAGADFVFEEDYDLPTLAQIEKFIKANKHLEGIASAKEMKTNGVKVGELQIQLLQKIEELTLYVIDLDKKNSVLQNENTQLKKQESINNTQQVMIKELLERIQKLENKEGK